LAEPARPWLDWRVHVPVGKLLDAARSHVAGVPGLPAVTTALKHGIRYLSLHTGLPALLVAAILVVVGYRLLKKTFRFAMEVAVIAVALVAMTQLGWIVW
jgi:hypothetical protein